MNLPSIHSTYNLNTAGSPTDQERGHTNKTQILSAVTSSLALNTTLFYTS